MTQFARKTDVSSDRSRAEIERTLRRYGADQFMYATSRERAVVGFKCHDLLVRFELPMPDPSASEFRFTPAKKQRRTEAQAYAAWEQASRQRWRALALVVKAKLEAVESGITTFEEEFLAHIVLPGGESVGAQLLPRIREAYTTGRVPPLLPFLED